MEHVREQYTEPAFYNFAAVAEELGALNNADVRKNRELTLSGNFTDDNAYIHAVLGVLHAYDNQRVFTDDPAEDFDNEQLRGIAFCLADIHYQTGHYAYCLGELKFIEQTLVMSDDESLKAYVNEAILDICELLGPDESVDPAPARTELLLS